MFPLKNLACKGLTHCVLIKFVSEYLIYNKMCDNINWEIEMLPVSTNV